MKRLWAMILTACLVAPASGAETSAVELGRQRYLDRCGICHGVDGRGEGPFSVFLKTSPPDLTVLELQNNGHFPFQWVYLAIDGRELPPAHGTREMPIWGRRFKHIAPQESETTMRGRIMELMLYLVSIQR